jgi:hypothetical protein
MKRGATVFHDHSHGPKGWFRVHEQPDMQKWIRFMRAVHKLWTRLLNVAKYMYRHRNVYITRGATVHVHSAWGGPDWFTTRYNMPKWARFRRADTMASPGCGEDDRKLTRVCQSCSPYVSDICRFISTVDYKLQHQRRKLACANARSQWYNVNVVEKAAAHAVLKSCQFRVPNREKRLGVLKLILLSSWMFPWILSVAKSMAYILPQVGYNVRTQHIVNFEKPEWINCKSRTNDECTADISHQMMSTVTRKYLRRFFAESPFFPQNIYIFAL